MHNWTISKRITIGFLAAVALTVVLGGFAYTRLTAIRVAANHIVTDALPGVYQISRVQDESKEDYLTVQRHVLTTNAQEMAQLETDLARSRERITKAFQGYDRSITRARDRELFDEVRAARPSFTDAIDAVIRLSRESRKEEAVEVLNGTLHPAATRYMQAIAEIVKFNKASGDIFAGDINQSVQSAVVGILVGSVAALVFGLGIAIWVSRSLTRILTVLSARLNDGAQQVASAAGQVSASSQSLAEGASEQAASLEETSASLEQMASLTGRNAEHAQTAKKLANQTRRAADTGAADMQEMTVAMDAIKTSGDNIAKIIKSIDEIAFQTNILALNAAVEAARAGEAGMGFAVVADEVRSLAQRSAQAAKETAEKIEDSIQKSEQGVDISAKVARSLAEIVEKARAVDDLVGEIASASREQNQGIQQVNLAVTQMDKVTQSNAANAEESASASEELNAQAATLKDAVVELVKLVGSDAGHDNAVSVDRADPVASKSRPSPREKDFNLEARGIQPLNGNGNGHGPAGLVSARAHREDELPMDGDFRDF